MLVDKSGAQMLPARIPVRKRIFPRFMIVSAVVSTAPTLAACSLQIRVSEAGCASRASVGASMRRVSYPPGPARRKKISYSTPRAGTHGRASDERAISSMKGRRAREKFAILAGSDERKRAFEEAATASRRDDDPPALAGPR